MQPLKPESENAKLKALVDEALHNLDGKIGSEFILSIKSTLYANLDRGRVLSFTDGDVTRVNAYVERVANSYLNLHPYIRRLQGERTIEVWGPLSKDLLLWAYNFLLRNGRVKNADTYEFAKECANTAAIAILDAYFPYDVDFEPWAHVLAQNVCRRMMRTATKKSVIPEQNIVELDEKLSTMDDSVLTSQKSQEDQSDILKAISQLSNARRQVIELHYFDDLSLPEIAIIMNQKVSEIYSLHFNALKNLRKILRANRDNN